MNNGMFRALTTDNRESKGWLQHHPLFDRWEIMVNNGGNYYAVEVQYHTIAEYTGKTDKNGTPIYGSKDFGEGMTRGGDVVKNGTRNSNVLFGEYYFFWHTEILIGFYLRDRDIKRNWDIDDDCEIINKQYNEVE